MEILAAMVLGHFSQSVGLGKFQLKTHEPSNPNVDGHHINKTQPPTGTLLTRNNVMFKHIQTNVCSNYGCSKNERTNNLVVH